jgi:hypothetical protein
MAENYLNPLATTSDVMRLNTYRIVVSGVDGSQDINMLCNKCTLTLPKSTPVELQWIGGQTNFGGRQQGAIELQLSFIVGVQEGDTLTALYNWRNLVFKHENGQIGLAADYKKMMNITCYDPSMQTERFKWDLTGVFPLSISDLPLDVSQDGPMIIDCQFRADKIVRA